jgi:hypothetical protein
MKMAVKDWNMYEGYHVFDYYRIDIEYRRRNIYIYIWWIIVIIINVILHILKPSCYFTYRQGLHLKILSFAYSVYLSFWYESQKKKNIIR